MKKITSLTFILLVLASSCKLKDQQDAVDYNDKLISYNDKIVEEFLLILSDVDEGKFDSAEVKRKNAVTICNNVLIGLKDEGGFDGDNKLQLATMKRVETMKDIISNETKTMLAIMAEMDAKDDLEEINILNEKMEKVTDEMVRKDDLSSKAFSKVQKEFAKEHNITLIENPLDKKIEAQTEETEEEF
jgi:hypothetical protein